MRSVVMMRALALALVMGFWGADALAAILSPAPPPELPDSLTDFRTKAQQNAAATANAGSDVTEEANQPLPPFVSGDESAGVVRYGGIYVPSQILTVPQYGMTVVRFYDVNNVPWDISSIKVGQQGYLAEVTAAPSEMVIRQREGAAATTMAVHLSGHDLPLVFSLRPVALVNQGHKVGTVLHQIRVRSLRDAAGYLPPPVYNPPVANPAARKVTYSPGDQDRVLLTLVEAVRELSIIKSENKEP